MRMVELRIGLIADTHGLLRPEALAALRGSDFIIHAGDVGDPQILVELAKIAPVTVVRGNIDRGSDAEAWPETAVLTAGALSIYVLHDRAELNPELTGCRVVISGHSHQPKIEEIAGVLYVNPGSAGRRRFKLPISVGELRIRGDSVTASLRELNPA